MPEQNKEPKGLEKILPFLEKLLEVQAETIQIRQFKGGYSNLTYLIQTPKKEYVLRRPPLGMKISKAHDMVREYQILVSLRNAGYSKVPPPVHCCEDETIIGAPFFIMERIDGLILRNKIPEGMDLDTEFFHQLSKNTIDGMLELHHLELDNSGLINLGKPDGYVERQVLGWSERYFKSMTDDIPEMEKVSDWLKKNMPVEEAIGFIHNDYKYDNLVLSGPENPKILAVLDWEMATIGHPLMDLGTTLAYWCEAEDPETIKMFNLTHPKGNFSRADVIQYYDQNSPLNLNNMIFYYAFGLFKVGVIAQQIYKRHKMGFADDVRFSGLIHVVSSCGKKALNSIQTQNI
ncbi:putative aminoglycoside phosphotransferase [Indibacter alkaliphilus LW1]|uniref:Aminoglycoside phosphotransferase n=1 Tax=Indibacter alkaliphilus (strain CCUG 57479 / KCTC 22604 / LW1) TaxID=1189612 RepID=S2E2E7_INDAL|nr:phosphotransferase family protein [Indibacter alkaliphilus]EOZ98641.1 putative aminoglycoside phosphotransferase [Indibacter alkaliphilus LW1]